MKTYQKTNRLMIAPVIRSWMDRRNNTFTMKAEETETYFYETVFKSKSIKCNYRFLTVSEINFSSDFLEDRRGSVSLELANGVTVQLCRTLRKDSVQTVRGILVEMQGFIHKSPHNLKTKFRGLIPYCAHPILLRTKSDLRISECLQPILRDPAASLHRRSQWRTRDCRWRGRSPLCRESAGLLHHFSLHPPCL